MRRAILLILSMLALSGCGPSAVVTPAATLAPSATPPPSASPAPEASPTPTAGTTPIPTGTYTETAAPDSTDAIPPGTLPRGSRVVETLTADCDGDGQQEGLVLYADADEDYTEGHGLVVEREGAVHHLGGTDPALLFVTDVAPEPVTVKVYDHNGDEQVELVVAGQIGIGPTAANVFAWDGSAYAALLTLVGEDGLSIGDDGTVTARSNPPGAGYSVDRTASWDGQRYRVDTHYTPALAPDTCLALEASPSCAVVTFYHLLEQGQPEAAHYLLALELRTEVAPAAMVERFGRTLTGLAEPTLQDDAATVPVSVASESAGRNAAWSLHWEEGRWVLSGFEPAAAGGEPSEEGMLRQLLGQDGYPVAAPAGEVLLHWLDADLDRDGQVELAARTGPAGQTGADRWSAGHVRILDPSADPPRLEAELPVDTTFLFEPSFEVTQVRPDGGLGIVEESACGAHASCLNLYTWDGSAYRAFSFSSSAMGIAVNADGNIFVGQRDAFTDPLTNGWSGVYSWDGDEYTLASLEFQGPAYAGPTGAVRAYYNAINVCLSEGDFHAAYGYLSRGFQAQHSYDGFAAGFADTVRVEVEDVTLVEEGNDAATVEATIVAVDRAGGENTADETGQTAYHATWQLTKVEGAWTLDQADVREQ